MELPSTPVCGWNLDRLALWSTLDEFLLGMQESEWWDSKLSSSFWNEEMNVAPLRCSFYLSWCNNTELSCLGFFSGHFFPKVYGTCKRRVSTWYSSQATYFWGYACALGWESYPAEGLALSMASQRYLQQRQTNVAICLLQLRSLEKEDTAGERETEARSLAQVSSLLGGRAGSETPLSSRLPVRPLCLLGGTRMVTWRRWHQTSSLELSLITFNLGSLLYRMLKPQEELKAEITTLLRGRRGLMYSWNDVRLSGNIAS